MKNYLKIVSVAMVSAMLVAGCGKEVAFDNSDAASSEVSVEASAETSVEATTEASVEESSEASSESSVEATAEASTDAASEGTFEDFVNNNAEIQKEIEDVESQLGVDISCEGNNLIYTYKIDATVTDSTKDAVTAEIDKQLEQNQETFDSMRKILEDASGVKDLAIVIRYVDNTDKQFYEKVM